MVTENTPSYFHGWAPNNKEVVYVAQRNGVRSITFTEIQSKEAKR